MILNVIYFSIFIPLSLQGAHTVTIDINKPLLVKAVVDSARIIGLPSSKAAKAYAQKIQAPDLIIKQITVIPDPVSDRQLFFRSYFK